MTTGDGMQPVAVNVGPCRCIGGADDPPHPDGDVVYLAPEASMTLGFRANGAVSAATYMEINPETGEPEPMNDRVLMETLVGRVFVEYGIVGWTFTDETGQPIQITRGARGEPTPETSANIERLLPWGRGGSAVAMKTNDLYSEAVLGPLVQQSLNTPPLGRTKGSTSVTRPSRAARRSSSKSSSPARSGIPR